MRKACRPPFFGPWVALGLDLLLGVASIGAAPLQSPGQVDRQSPPAESAGFDARLTGYPYPFAVRTLSIESQGQALELAYMDESPSGSSRGNVLLLHGKNFAGWYWKRTIDALISIGYRVIVPDQVGFGKSSKPTTFQYSFHALADHTNRLLDHLEIGKCIVIGHSMGGMLGVRLALMVPGRVERLVLVDPIGLEDWKRIVPYVPVEKLFDRELHQTYETARQYMQESYFHGEWKAEYEPLLAIQAGWMRGPDRRELARVSALTSDMIFTQPVLYELDELAMPTLLIIGRLDRTAIGKQDVSKEIAATLGHYEELGALAAGRIPHAKLVEIPGVGHVPQYEAFETYWSAVAGFLEP